MTAPKRLRNNTIRALKACESCRHQKSRCYPSEDPSGSCLRCLSVGRACSFIVDGAPPRVLMALNTEDPNSSGTITVSAKYANTLLTQNVSAEGTATNAAIAVSGPSAKKQKLAEELNSNDRKRLKDTNVNVKKILQILNKMSSENSGDSNQSNVKNVISLKNSVDEVGEVSIKTPPTESSPFLVIRSSVNSGDVPLSIEQILSPFNNQPLDQEEEPENILSLGIIGIKHAINLINNFKRNYGKWISISDSIPTDQLIKELKFKCPLLLTSICLTSLRFNISTSRSNNEESLQRQLSIRLNQELKEFLTSANEFKSFEFLQALVILSIHGLSLTNQEVSMDPWLLSGLAIQWFLTLDINQSLLIYKDRSEEENTTNTGTVNPNELFNKEQEKLSHFRIWNHLCLVHLSNCIFSGRMCVIDEVRINQTRKLFELTETNHFDGRMIAEISLELLLYNFIQTTTAVKSTLDLNSQYESFEEEIKQWHDEWDYLIQQPEEQYLDFSYHFSFVAALYHVKLGHKSLLKSQNNDNEEIIQDFETLNKILYHSLKVLNHILKLNDIELFMVLSDQIHFSLYYVAIIFLKVIRWIDIVDKGEVYKKNELSSFIDKVDNIKKLFAKISKLDSDIANKYAKGLHSAISESREFVNA